MMIGSDTRNDPSSRTSVLAGLERWVAWHGRLPRDHEVTADRRADIEAHFGSWESAMRHVRGTVVLHHSRA